MLTRDSTSSWGAAASGSDVGTPKTWSIGFDSVRNCTASVGSSNAAWSV